MSKAKSNVRKAEHTIENEDSMNSESDNESTVNSEIDEDSVNSESDNADLMEDTNDDEEPESDNADSVKNVNNRKEEIELHSCEIECHAVNQEKKRKKVTDELNEVASKKKKFENSLYKQPTVEELSQLRETENLFHSNLFRLQIEEVLNEVKLKDKYKALFEIWFEKLKATIESIEETEEILVGNTTECVIYDNRIMSNLLYQYISACR